VSQLRASYVAYDHLDEPTAANSLSFNLHVSWEMASGIQCNLRAMDHVCAHQGSKIYAGYNRMVRVFDVGEPGHSCESHATSKTRKSSDGQRGILSCISFNPDYSGSVLWRSFQSPVLRMPAF
jgi:telomerase Cajal body protein 1